MCVMFRSETDRYPSHHRDKRTGVVRGPGGRHDIPSSKVIHVHIACFGDKVRVLADYAQFEVHGQQAIRGLLERTAYDAGSLTVRQVRIGGRQDLRLQRPEFSRKDVRSGTSK